jgi:hypothetical protein
VNFVFCEFNHNGTDAGSDRQVVRRFRMNQNEKEESLFVNGHNNLTIVWRVSYAVNPKRKGFVP